MSREAISALHGCGRGHESREESQLMPEQEEVLEVLTGITFCERL